MIICWICLTRRLSLWIFKTVPDRNFIFSSIFITLTTWSYVIQVMWDPEISPAQASSLSCRPSCATQTATVTTNHTWWTRLHQSHLTKQDMQGKLIHQHPQYVTWLPADTLKANLLSVLCQYYWNFPLLKYAECLHCFGIMWLRNINKIVFWRLSSGKSGTHLCMAALRERMSQCEHGNVPMYQQQTSPCDEREVSIAQSQSNTVHHPILNHNTEYINK